MGFRNDVSLQLAPLVYTTITPCTKCVENDVGVGNFDMIFLECDAP